MFSPRRAPVIKKKNHSRVNNSEKIRQIENIFIFLSLTYLHENRIFKKLFFFFCRVNIIRKLTPIFFVISYPSSSSSSSVVVVVVAIKSSLVYVDHFSGAKLNITLCKIKEIKFFTSFERKIY